MASGVNSIIEPLDYNSIQTVIAGVLGVGTGNSGYGQALSSSAVASNAIISKAQMAALRTDLSKARVHQTNTAVADGLASIAGNRGTPWQTLQDVNIVGATLVSENIRDQYSQFATGVQSNEDTASAAQLTPGIAVTSQSRSADWNGSISTTFTVTFGGYTQGSLTVSGADHARCFFNAGGSFQLTANNLSYPAGASFSKSDDWHNLLVGFGTLTFSRSTSSITGSLNAGGSVASSTGFRSLTVGAAATRILTQTSSVSVYNENVFYVDVARPTAATMTFKLTYFDQDTGGNQSPVAPGSSPGTPAGPVIDENVQGTLSGTLTTTRPSGANVDVPAATGTASAIA
jgi:hypothetical protein